MFYIRKIILILLIFTSCACGCKAEHSASQEISALLKEILQIEAVRVNATDYRRDAGFGDNVVIESINKSNPNLYLLSLSSMDVRVHTNAGGPIYVNAEFLSLRKTDGTHIFNQQDLYFTPNSITVNKPYDHMWVESFTPMARTRTTTMSGDYTGEVLFTLGAI